MKFQYTLTKKDIESLGWKCTYFMGSDLEDGGSSQFYLFRKGFFEIRWWGETTYITIYNFTHEPELLNGKSSQINDFSVLTETCCIYEGQCPSKKELKLLQALLEIPEIS